MYQIAKTELIIAAHRHRLLGRAVVITGASSGIGTALARAYAGPGMVLALHGRDAERLSAVATSCRARGAHVLENTGDVTDAQAMADWLAQVHAQAPLGLVVANAGISGGPPAGDSAGIESLAQATAILATNLQGVLNTLHPAIALMQQARANTAPYVGQLAIISSLAGFLPMPSAPAYSTSKAAVRYYGEAMAPALQRAGIALSVVCPGFIKTPMTAINNFYMPMLMTPEEAADRIMLGLAQQKRLVTFPLTLSVLLRVLDLLPRWALRPILASLPNKPANTQSE